MFGLFFLFNYLFEDGISWKISVLFLFFYKYLPEIIYENFIFV